MIIPFLHIFLAFYISYHITEKTYDISLFEAVLFDETSCFPDVTILLQKDMIPFLFWLSNIP